MGLRFLLSVPKLLQTLLVSQLWCENYRCERRWPKATIPASQLASAWDLTLMFLGNAGLMGVSVIYAKGMDKTQHPHGVWVHIMLWWPKRQVQERLFDVLTFSAPSERGRSKCILLELSFCISPVVVKPMTVVLFVLQAQISSQTFLLFSSTMGYWSLGQQTLSHGRNRQVGTGCRSSLTHTFINWLPHIVLSWERKRKWDCLFIQRQLKGLVFERRNKNLFNKWVKIERREKKSGVFWPGSLCIQTPLPAPVANFLFFLAGWAWMLTALLIIVLRGLRAWPLFE